MGNFVYWERLINKNSTYLETLLYTLKLMFVRMRVMNSLGCEINEVDPEQYLGNKTKQSKTNKIENIRVIAYNKY